MAGRLQGRRDDITFFLRPQGVMKGKEIEGREGWANVYAYE